MRCPVHIGLFGAGDEFIQIIAQWRYFANTPVGLFGIVPDKVFHKRLVAVSCGAGYGRTGTILACYLVSQYYSADAAIKEVRCKRPSSIETKSQEEIIKKYASTLNK